MTNTGILLEGLELDAIQEQLNQLIEWQQNLFPDDSLEAITLGKTIKLLTDIEYRLELAASSN